MSTNLALVRSPMPGTARRWRRIVRLALVVTMLAFLAVEAGVIGPYFGRAVDYLSDTDLRWLVLAVPAELWSVVAFARLQRRMLSAGGTHVPLRTMIGLTYAANALSVTLPAGSALSSGYTFRRLRGFGASAPLAGFTLITSGILSTAAFALLGLTGSVVIGVDRMNLGMVSAEVLAAIGLAYVVHRVTAEPIRLQRTVSVLLGWSNRARRRPLGTGETAAREFLHGFGEIKPRTRDWAAGLAFSTANWLTDLVCLAASCRAVGIGVSVPLVTVAFLAGATVSSLSLLPGGIGAVDAAMIVALTHGGLHVAPATAAVVLYRLISFVLIVALGWLAWTLNWHRERLQPARSPGHRSRLAPDALTSPGAHRSRRPAARPGAHERSRRSACVPTLGTSLRRTGEARGSADPGPGGEQHHPRDVGAPAPESIGCYAAAAG